MELVVDVGHIESCFGPFGDGVGVGARYVHGLRQTYHRLRKSIWTHPMELLCDLGHVESCFGLFGDGVCNDTSSVTP
jgi:hypothetical protein